jgi:ribonuclease Z
MGQLERCFGRAEADRRILQLHAVWISHMHADHHGGLYPLLLQREFLLQQASAAAAAARVGTGKRRRAETLAKPRPLLIFGPNSLYRVLCLYSKVLPLSFMFLPNDYFYSQTAKQPAAEALAAYEAVKAAAGLSVLQPFPVQHVSNSSGLQVQSKTGWKVVFSGALGHGSAAQ